MKIFIRVFLIFFLLIYISCSKKDVQVYIDIDINQIKKIGNTKDPDWANFSCFFLKIKGPYKITRLWVEKGKPVKLQLDPAAFVDDSAFEMLTKVSSLREVYFLNIDFVNDYQVIVGKLKNHNTIYYCTGNLKKLESLKKPFVGNWDVYKSGLLDPRSDETTNFGQNN